ncbi:MAG: hypothetical protein WCH79_03480 [Planctomycetia bacterium]
MPPTQPWRDISPASAVQAELHRLDGGTHRPPGNTQQRAALKATVLSQIDAYHRVPKDSFGMLKTRAGMLHSIASAARQLWGGDARARFSEIGPIVAALSDKATQKANYIEKLHAFYEGEGQGVFRGEDLLNFLTSPPHNAGGVLANLQRGCRMERIDPAHRAFEVHLDPSTPFTNADFQCGMNWAFAQWCGCLMNHPQDDSVQTVRPNFTVNDIDAASLPPFFLWLENHSICLGADQDNFGIYGFSPAEVTGVLYSPYGQAERAAGGRIKAVEGIHWLVRSSESVVMEMPLDDPKGGMRLFDTMHLPGKGHEEKQSAAYVWTKCGTLLAGEHAAGELHHSSFVAGDDVRCAGMIRIASGKVEMISSNSGHYRPSEVNLRQFASWLNDKQVFSQTAYARFFSGDSLVNEGIPAFLGLGAVTGRFAKPNRVTPALDQLGQLVATAVTRYNESGTRVQAFNFMRNLTKSTESKEAVVYLQNDFPRDIEVAKLNTSEEQWWTVPMNVIESLLGVPGNVPFATIQGKAQQLSPVIGKSNPRFSTGIDRLVPLKQPSTMHTILSEEWRKWQRPPPV